MAHLLMYCDNATGYICVMMLIAIGAYLRVSYSDKEYFSLWYAQTIICSSYLLWATDHIPFLSPLSLYSLCHTI